MKLARNVSVEVNRSVLDVEIMVNATYCFCSVYHVCCKQYATSRPLKKCTGTVALYGCIWNRILLYYMVREKHYIKRVVCLKLQKTEVCIQCTLYFPMKPRWIKFVLHTFLLYRTFFLYFSEVFTYSKEVPAYRVCIFMHFIFMHCIP